VSNPIPFSSFYLIFWLDTHYVKKQEL